MLPIRCFALFIGIIGIAPLAGCIREAPQKGDLDAARKAVEARAKELQSESERLLAEWQPKLTQAAKDIKVELDKAVPTSGDWELIVEPPEEGADKLKVFDEKLAKLDRVKIGDVTVAYEQCDERTVAGVRYQRHFRAQWVGADRVYCVACCTQKSVEVAAFLDLLKRLVPASNEVLKHVTVARGKAAR